MRPNSVGDLIWLQFECNNHIIILIRTIFMRKVCSFFGHRKIELSVELEQKVKDVVEDLIVNHNVSTFLFGSRSEFDSLCLSVVTNLKEKYPYIKRVAYTCKNETSILESEKLKLEDAYSFLLKRKVTLYGVEEEFEHKTKYTAGRASYIERNQAMINDSDYCLFYYNENYQPQMRKHSTRSVGYYQPKSGTKVAYHYAKRKNKVCINVFFT